MTTTTTTRHPVRIAVDASTGTASETAHLLPCRVRYAGAAPVSEYFTPTATRDERDGTGRATDATHEAYFRGRRLVGTAVDLPEGYTGLVLDDTAPSRTQVVRARQGEAASRPSRRRRRRRGEDDEDDDDEDGARDGEDEDEDEAELEEHSTWRTRARFDRVVVYGNAAAVESSDAVLRGLREWVALAGVIHGTTGTTE